MSCSGRLLSAALPDVARLTPRSRGALAAVAAFTLVVLMVNMAHTGLGLGGDRLDLALNAWLQNVVVAGALALVIARAALRGPERASWIALAAAIGCWGAGNLYWNLVLYSVEEPPFPSPADVGWLLFYPCAYVCLGLRVRSAARQLPRSLWLDGLVGLLSVGAVGTVLVVAPVLEAAEGNRAAVLTNAAYPMADLLLFGLCVAIVALHGWRPGRGWFGLAFGFALFAAADSVYLTRLASGTYAPGGVLDAAWLVALVVMSLAAWGPAPPKRDVELGGWAVVVPPLACGVAALLVLLAGSLGREPVAATSLAGAALLASMVRTALTFADLGRLAEVRRLAATDALTGLPNRRDFNRRRGEALEHARAEGTVLALLLIDLNRFKELNDALGHHAGDAVLAQVGPRLRSVLRVEDELSRIGGDEFAVLLPGARSVEAVARRLGDALEQRFSVDGIDVRIGASIGIALYPEHGTDAETLLQHADVAMYQAKAMRSGHAFYARDRDHHSRERFGLIGELRDAIANSELVVYYQPKLNLRTGAVEDVEALVRWQHPTRGLLPPDQFVPLAEPTGVMRALTDYVLDAALAQCARFREAGFDLGVAVNVSPATLFDESWASEIPERLKRFAVPATRLRIEITEDAIMLNPERSLAVLRELAAAGVGVSLDDFGTGYSTLSMLKQLPVDELKIDRSFLADALVDRADAAIVQTAIDLGRRLGIRVVAEGVEDAATLDLLGTWGADAAQGYYISRPVPADQLGAWLNATSRHGRWVPSEPLRTPPRAERRHATQAGHPPAAA
ncbi:MAG TPA: EAL domain-containing protein [Baekduia sp.]|nr:EAL domain-containing protein [Baekduia sp.]